MFSELLPKRPCVLGGEILAKIQQQSAAGASSPSHRRLACEKGRLCDQRESEGGWDCLGYRMGGKGGGGHSKKAVILQQQATITAISRSW